MPNAIKNAARAVIFLGGLVLLLFLLSQVFTPAEGTIDDGVNTVSANGIIGEENNTIDAVFVGDSVVYSAITPLQLWQEHGIASYSCGTLAQKLWYTQDMLRKAFRNQSPKVVMLETDALFTKFNFDDSIMHKAETVLPVLQYHDRWKVLAKDIFGEREEVTTTNTYKGYVLSFKISPSDNVNYMKQKLSSENVPSRNKSYLKEIKNYCDDHGAKLILFSCPSTKNWNNARHSTLVKISDDLGIDYIDLNTIPKEIGIDWSKDTRDGGDHLNYYGASKVTGYLGKYLEDLGLLADRRSDEAYESWNDETEKYLKKIAKKTK